MYCKRILILQTTDFRFAEPGKNLCGMVKLVNVGKTDVTVFVANAAPLPKGSWWLLVSFGEKTFAERLSTLNNHTFTLPLQNLQNVCCILVHCGTQTTEVASAFLGQANFGVLRRNIDSLIAQTPFQNFSANLAEQTASTVQMLKSHADDKYGVVANYSAAFERFYAFGGGQNYYKFVKPQLTALLNAFPPYYPLIKRYADCFFVRVEFLHSDSFFTLGLLQKNDVVRYVCYGIPATANTPPDKDFFRVHCSPTDFWMLFQDAYTGRIIVFA